jgi:predicted oxidoreductase
MLGLSESANPRFAYGLWRYGGDDSDQALRMLELARANGIEHFDTADVYGGRNSFGAAEQLLGELRARAPEVFAGAALATKIGVEHGSPYNSSPEYLERACEASPRRLGVERIDLLYIHRPDLLAHPEQVAKCLDNLVSAGKISAIGVSNYSATQLDALHNFLTNPIAAHQVEISALATAPIFDGTLDQAMRLRIAIVAWSPLAGGRLGEATTDDNPAIKRVKAALTDIAQRHDASPEAVALAFLRAHPAAITPILGTRTPDRLKACLSCQQFELSRADWYAILEASQGARMP